MTAHAADAVSDARLDLLEAAGRVLAEQGAQAFSTRNIAAESGVSKMGVYTHFGSLGGLAHAVVDEGFRRLAAHISEATMSGDVRADIKAISLAFLQHGRQNANHYRVMFGAAPLGQFGPLTSEEMNAGARGTLDEIVALIERGTQTGVFTPGSAWRRGNQWFAAVHGYTLLEISGYIRPTDGPEKVLDPLIEGVLLGFTIDNKAGQ